MPKKAEKSKRVQEQTRRAELSAFMTRSTQYLPEPAYRFSVGDRVEMGNLKDVYVCGVINDKIYEIDYTSVDSNYGCPIVNEHQKRFVTWLDIRPYTEHPNESLMKNQEIRLTYLPQPMESIFSRVYQSGTDFDPEYQRDFVWGREDQIALIDSIFNKIDIGKFVFVKKDFGEKFAYEIVDGKQRLKAALDYYENRFPYEGLYYNDLCRQDRRYFKEYSVLLAEIENCDHQQILKYFVMLNKHGRIMDKAQIEKVEQMIDRQEQGGMKMGM